MPGITQNVGGWSHKNHVQLSKKGVTVTSPVSSQVYLERPELWEGPGEDTGK